MIDLKSCPFCGKSVADFATACQEEECANFESDECPCYDRNEDHSQDCAIHFVVCNRSKGGCGASIGWYLSAEEAAEAWNRRVV